jgi:hypothetical protein
MELDVAIIEYEDGVVTECYPYEVKFTDKEEKADAEGWETKRMGTDWINLCPTCAKEV